MIDPAVQLAMSQSRRWRQSEHARYVVNDHGFETVFVGPFFDDRQAWRYCDLHGFDQVKTGLAINWDANPTIEPPR